MRSDREASTPRPPSRPWLNPKHFIRAVTGTSFADSKAPEPVAMPASVAARFLRQLFRKPVSCLRMPSAPFLLRGRTRIASIAWMAGLHHPEGWCSPTSPEVLTFPLPTGRIPALKRQPARDRPGCAGLRGQRRAGDRPSASSTSHGSPSPGRA